MDGWREGEEDEAKSLDSLSCYEHYSCTTSHLAVGELSLHCGAIDAALKRCYFH